MLILGRLILLGVVLLAWEAAPRLHLVHPQILPPFSEVFATLLQLLGQQEMRMSLVITLSEILVTFLIALPAGALIGLAIAENERLNRVIKPFVFFLFGIPKSIFLPLFILSLGIGFWQKVSFGVFSTIVSVILSSATAIESVSAQQVLVARSYGATRFQIVRRVYFPSVLPILLEGIRIAVHFCFTAIVLAEMYVSRAGIGRHMAEWGEAFMMKELLAGVLLLSILAIGTNETVRLAEKQYGRWRI